MGRKIMTKIQFNLAPQCRMMKVCGIDIIGNPITGTIIGLDDEGMSLIQKMQLHEEIDISSLNDNQSMLVDALSSSGFFLVRITLLMFLNHIFMLQAIVI